MSVYLTSGSVGVIGENMDNAMATWVWACFRILPVRASAGNWLAACL